MTDRRTWNEKMRSRKTEEETRSEKEEKKRKGGGNGRSALFKDAPLQMGVEFEV